MRHSLDDRLRRELPAVVRMREVVLDHRPHQGRVARMQPERQLERRGPLLARSVRQRPWDGHRPPKDHEHAHLRRVRSHLGDLVPRHDGGAVADPTCDAVGREHDARRRAAVRGAAEQAVQTQAEQEQPHDRPGPAAAADLLAGEPRDEEHRAEHGAQDRPAEHDDAQRAARRQDQPAAPALEPQTSPARPHQEPDRRTADDGESEERRAERRERALATHDHAAAYGTQPDEEHRRDRDGPRLLSPRRDHERPGHDVRPHRARDPRSALPQRSLVVRHSRLPHAVTSGRRDCRAAA